MFLLCTDTPTQPSSYTNHKCKVLLLGFNENILSQCCPFADITEDTFVEGPDKQLTRDIVNELTGNFFSYVLSIREASLAKREEIKTLKKNTTMDSEHAQRSSPPVHSPLNWHSNVSTLNSA